MVANKFANKFETNVGAMVAHAESHKKDEITRVFKYVLGRGARTNIFHPEEHAVKESTGKYYAGAGTKLHCIVVPETYGDWRSKGILSCRKCDGYHLEYHEGMHLQLRGRRALKMKKHEKTRKVIPNGAATVGAGAMPNGRPDAAEERVPAATEGATLGAQ
eukprot:gene248-74_t